MCGAVRYILSFAESRNIVTLCVVQHGKLYCNVRNKNCIAWCQKATLRQENERMDGFWRVQNFAGNMSIWEIIFYYFNFLVIWKNATLNVISGTPRYNGWKISIQLIEHMDTADGICLCQRNISNHVIEHLGTTEGITLCQRNTSIHLIEHLDTKDGITLYQWNTSIHLIEHLYTTDGITLYQWNTSIHLIEHLDTTDENSVSVEYFDTPDRTPGYNGWNNCVSVEHFDTPHRTPGYNGWKTLYQWNISIHLIEHLDTTDGITLYQWNTSIHLIEHLDTTDEKLCISETPRYTW